FSFGFNYLHSPAIVSSPAQLLDEGQKDFLPEEVIPVFDEMKFRGGNLMRPEEYFLRAFVLDKLDDVRLRENLFAFLFQLFKCIRIHMFDLDRNDVCFPSEIQYGIIVVEASAIKTVTDIFTGSICIRIEHSIADVEISS